MKIVKCPEGHETKWHNDNWYCSICDIYVQEPKKRRKK